MKWFAWSLFLLGLLLSAGAALFEWVDLSWLAVLLASLSGATFSVLSSLVVNRMTMVHQQLAEVLAKVKRTNPLSPQLGHEIRIQRELLTDMGVKENDPVIVELNSVIAACDRQASHGLGADPLYRVLKTAVFRSSIQSIFCPHFGHSKSKRSRGQMPEALGAHPRQACIGAQKKARRGRFLRGFVHGSSPI